MMREIPKIDAAHKRSGFSLIELLVVLSVIGLLLGLLLPAVQQARAAARRAQCQNHLHQLGIALHSYHELHRILPPGALVIGPVYSTTFQGWGWGSMILPMIDQSALHARIDFRFPTAVGENETLLSRPIPLWRCPSDLQPDSIAVSVDSHPPTTISTGNYAGASELIGPLSAIRFSRVTDGLSQTLMVGERVSQSAAPGNPPFTASWAGLVAKTDAYIFNSMPYTSAVAQHPINSTMGSTQSFSSRHSGGAHFAFADGAVKFLNQNIDTSVYEGLGTPNGGEIIEY